MELYKLGKVTWEQSQLIYHALAYLGREAVCICIPSSPYFCIGYHQDVSQEVDLDFSAARNIPVFRREVGGGGVYLDANQVFFHVIVRQSNPQVSMCHAAFYRKFLEPVIRAYNRMGIPATYKQMADIVVGERKISGIGAGEIGDCVVLVGNLIIDFDFDTMCRILKMPDDRFRARVRSVMEDNMTTVRREIGSKVATHWNQNAIADLLIAEYGRLLGPLKHVEPDSDLLLKMEELAHSMTQSSWLHEIKRKGSGRTVTIRSGLQLCRELINTPLGDITVDFENREGVSNSVSVFGEACDFMGSEFNRFRASLVGIPSKEMRRTVSEFLSKSSTSDGCVSRQRGQVASVGVDGSTS